MIPNLYLIGAQKAGTTLLHSLLCHHPSIEAGRLKEPGFHTRHRDKGINWYLELFSGASSEYIIDSSTTYALTQSFPDAPDRIFSFNSYSRIIFSVRDPYERIESGWMQLRSQGLDISPDFVTAIRTYPQLIEASMYWHSYVSYAKVFGPNNIKVIRFDDLICEPIGVTQSLLAFLELDADIFPSSFEPKNTNVSQDKLEWRPSAERLRSLPGFSQAVKMIPATLRRRLLPIAKRPLTRRPRWDLRTLDFVHCNISEDGRRILELLGADVEAWEHSYQQRRQLLTS